MKTTYVIVIVLSLCTSVFGSQATFTPRTTDMVVVKNMSGGTTTAGIALSGSTTVNALQLADWAGSGTACIGFSNGVLGQVIVFGKVTFALGGLTPGEVYYVGAGGTVSAIGTTTTGYITQRILRAIGTNTAIIQIEPPTTN